MGKRKVTQYTLEFKESSAKLAVESEQSISQTARGLGVNETTLHGWVHQYYPRSSKSASRKDEVNLQEENKRLTKEVKRLTLEKEILKKAAVDSISQRNIIQYVTNYWSMMNGTKTLFRLLNTRG